jgi:hypothetical protein
LNLLHGKISGHRRRSVKVPLRALFIIGRDMRRCGAHLYSKAAGRFDVLAHQAVIVDSVSARDSFQAAMLAWLLENRRTAPAEPNTLTALRLAEHGQFAGHAAAITLALGGVQHGRTCIAPDHLRRLTECAQESASHSLAVSEAGLTRHEIDRQSSLFH